MKHVQLELAREFAVVAGNARSQAAEMVLAPGHSEGGPDNRHRGSDQWLFVVSGEGSATIAGEIHVLRPGTLVLIERGETHEITSNGDEPLRTVNVYVPPVYSAGGEELATGTS